MSKVTKARGAGVRLMSLHDVRAGLAAGDVDADAGDARVEIAQFSSGYRGNGLAQIASAADVAFAATGAGAPRLAAAPARPAATKREADAAAGAAGGPKRARASEFTRMKVSELREELSKRGLDVGGLKAELLARLDASARP